MSIKVQKSKNWIFLLAVILTLGIFGMAGWADARSSYLTQYNTYFGTSEGCGLCHVNPGGGGTLNATGNAFGSAHNYAAIKPTDTMPPTVAITTPTSSPTYSASSSSLSIGGTASDNFTGPFGVTQVSWSNSLGGSGTASGTTSWTATVSLSSGSNVITVTARDEAGNTGTDTITATYTPQDTTAPTVSITAPTNAQTVSGTVTVTASASDNVGVAGVQFKLDGTNLGTEDTASPYSVSWNTATASNASHTLTAVARDAAGNTTTSAAITVTVSNATSDTSPPTVSITAPTNAQTVSATVTVTASASDNVGVTGVQFKLDGVNLGTEDTTSPYSVSWNTATASNGSHTLTAVARDAAGNTTTATAVTVTVSNATPPPTPEAPDLTIWVGQWLKITSRYNGYLAQSSKLSAKRASVVGYIKFR
ncbi:MAG TPA: Ig-like domain-containing protein, partial [Thermodesulfobacteriota bacterium]|nr:Ig-like domain-containing protein [Thermodesulfobacteriota bacterium]